MISKPKSIRQARAPFRLSPVGTSGLTAIALVLGAAACSSGENGGTEAGPDGSGASGAGASGAGASVGDGDGDGDGVDPAETGIVPLFSATGEMLQPVLEDTPEALITRFGDRGRDRHAREEDFGAYDHYLSHYWEDRTMDCEITDTVGKDPAGGSITFRCISEYKLSDNEAELRFFYRGIGTIAEYHGNGTMDLDPDYPVPTDHKAKWHYIRSADTYRSKEGDSRPLQVGDNMEFELSQFLDDSVEQFGGRANYYGTTYLYVAGVGLVPWTSEVEASQNSCPCPEAYSVPIAEEGWLGGRTTLPYQYSNEPRDHFMQMATNLAGEHAQPFVRGRRVDHTEFLNGTHTENGYDGGDIIDNPTFPEQAGKLGPQYINESCDACHVQNTRSLPPAVGEVIDQFVFKVGDAEGNPLPDIGGVFQPGDNVGASEGTVRLASWTEENGLRSPNYEFTGATPEYFSARMAPQLVGMGLLEAIPEDAILALADPNDADGDGISGTYREVYDPVADVTRLGRFGWKSGQPTVMHQVAGALNTDMGVMTSIYPEADCGSAQSNCQTDGGELSDEDLDDLTVYISLLGLRARRNLDDPTALAGEALFDSVGCADCHTTTFQTSPYAKFGEVRDQTIHPYTDMLLHDMGEGLADNLGEGTATGAEWRTTPLWNIGLTADVNGGEAYLHDGRARTLEEAILWHGGESQASKEAYEGLTSEEQQALIAFLKSL